MSTQIHGPVDYRDTPDVVRRGESWKLRVPVYDGARTASSPKGALVDISAATKKLVLTINGVMASAADLTRDTSVSGEGEKTDSNTATFFIAYTVTEGANDFKPGVYEWQVEYQDSAPTPADRKLVAIGRLLVLAKPSAL